MKKLLLLLFFITLLTTVNADFSDKVKGSFSQAKEEVKNKFRDEVRHHLEKNCVKMPFFTEYYICPPINPDKI